MAHRLAPEAEADLDELWFYVATHSSTETADRLVDSLTSRPGLAAPKALARTRYLEETLA